MIFLPVIGRRKPIHWSETLSDRYFLFTRTDPNRVATLSTQLVSPLGPYHEHFEPFNFQPSITSPQSPDAVSSNKNSSHSRFSEEQFGELIGELRILTAKAHKEELFNEIRSEWMFAAMVVDRVFFGNILPLSPSVSFRYVLSHSAVSSSLVRVPSYFMLHTSLLDFCLSENV